MFHDLYAQMEWADATVWRAVLAHDGATNDDRVRNLLLHLHMTQQAFLLIWRNEELKFPPADAFKTVDDVLAVARTYYDAVAPFIASISDSDGAMIMPWAERYHSPAHPTTLADTLVQVAMHSMYHRGQVNARLRELGAEPPLVDYISWIWMGRPRGAWPESGTGHEHSMGVVSPRRSAP